MTDITTYGITVRLPSGWDGRISRRTGDAIGTEHPVVHIASFSLPNERGDYGSGAVERMRSTDVLLCTIEFDPAGVRGDLFARKGVPRFRVQDFSPNAMQRTISGMCGAQAFFTEAGRAFCAYAVLGSFRARAGLLPSLNDALAGIRIVPQPTS